MIRKILIGLGVLVAIAVIYPEALTVILGLGSVLLFLGIFASPFILGETASKRSDKALRENRIKKNKDVRARQNIEALDAFGSSPETRAAAIDALFDRRDGSITCQIDYLNAAVGTFTAELSRPVAGMKPRDREVLRAVYHLHNLGHTSDYDFYFQRLGIIWGDGAATAPTRIIHEPSRQGFADPV
jgi:hypothetical protein